MGAGIRVRRVYDEPAAEDGTRILVDRVWPRGLRKDAARLDDWAKDVAPSTELRTWYRHDPAKFGEFRRRYAAELTEPGPGEALNRIRALAARGPVTLLTATRDLDISQAAVLAGLLREASGLPARTGLHILIKASDLVDYCHAFRRSPGASLARRPVPHSQRAVSGYRAPAASPGVPPA